MMQYTQNAVRCLIPLHLVLVLWVALALWTSNAVGQTVSQPRVQAGPYYVGEPVVVQISVKGVTNGKDPVCRLVGEPEDGIQVAGPQVSQSVSRFMQITNGRSVTEENVNYRFNFVVTATRAGTFSIGPFQVEHGDDSVDLSETTLRFQTLSNDDSMFIDVSLPSDALYVGQRVPVTVKWGFSGASYEVVYAFQNLVIRSPLFDQFTFDDPSPRTRTTLSFESEEGEVAVDAVESSEVRGQQQFVVLTCTRMMVVDSVGDFAEIPVTCHTKRGVGWRNDLFGRASPQRSKPAYSKGESISFTVKTLPKDGQPASFAGAVGSGYSIDVSANRSVVRVGDPISLTVQIHGEGLEKLSLPDLTADGGMDPTQFQLPQDSPSGTFSGSTKQFKVNVRVNDESVNQIPAIPFSWFDTQKEQYFTARSKPIALQVMPAQMVSASDVVSAAPSVPSSTSARTSEQSTTAPSQQLSPAALSQGANLAIEKDDQNLLASGSGFLSSGTLQNTSYVLGFVALIAAVAIRRQSDVDPAQRRRLQQKKLRRQQILDAGNATGKQAAEQLATCLRSCLPLADSAQRAALSDIIRQCEDAIYAPSDTAFPARELSGRALQTVEGLE